MTESSDDVRPRSGPAPDRPARSDPRKAGRRHSRAAPPTRRSPRPARPAAGRLRHVSAQLTGVNAFAPV
ncbi:MAG TPA: hypothetical protein VGM12_11680 [Trebonia sp.]|jgi:hypothetical protein